MGFPRQEYWSGLPCPPPGDPPDPAVKLTSPAAPALQADSCTAEQLWKPNLLSCICFLIPDVFQASLPLVVPAGGPSAQPWGPA